MARVFLMEHVFTCPVCWQQISMLIDTSQRAASYVEDCEVCCHPLSISFCSDGERVVSFNAEFQE